MSEIAKNNKNLFVIFSSFRFVFFPFYFLLEIKSNQRRIVQKKQTNSANIQSSAVADAYRRC